MNIAVNTWINTMQGFDTEILLWIQENLRSDVFTPFWKMLTFLGNVGWFWIVLGMVLVCFKQTRIVGISVLLSLMFSFAVTNVVLKNLVARTRPFDAVSTIIPLITRPKDYSFPSGHTSAAFAAAFICYMMLPRRYGGAALLLAVLVACSRLYLGVHYPSDVLGGIVIALAGSVLVKNLVEQFQKKAANKAHAATK